MGNTTAGSVGGGNDGKTDMGRGNKMNFTYSKGGRPTGKIAGGISSGANGQSVDANKRTVSDPRLAG